MGQFFSTNRSLKLSLIALTIGCSPKVDFPAINTPIDPINIEACRNVEVNSRNLTPQNFRGVIHCLNGEKQALAPIEKLLDNSTDSQIHNRF